MVSKPLSCGRGVALMSDKVVELIRRFTLLSTSSQSRRYSISSLGPTRRWPDLVDERRVLILADPGAGKTFETLTRARKMHASGRAAFFVRIEKLDGNFEGAFEVGDAVEFAAWLTSNGDAWFFLDSVDEAQLETPRALETAIRIFGARIYDARHRAHVFITSREDAWDALPDQTLVKQFLPYGEPEKDDDASERAEASDPLTTYRLAGLTEDEIALFASHYGVGDTRAFITAIERGGLQTLAERPFDLKALIRKWNADQALGGRFEVLQRLIELQLAPVSANGGPSPAATRQAARTLAAAVMLTGKSLICLPTGVHSPDRIDPRTLLPDWSEDDIDRLLQTGVFDDVVYTCVRFRHREIRELLSAEWAHDQLSRPGARGQVEDLFFRERYGEQVIVPRTRSTLAWLILLDDHVRQTALNLEPELASEGGDPSQLPADVRRKMLADIVARIAAE
jgi:hypothetical protein